MEASVQVYPGIDVDRGVTIRSVPGSDIKVFMYKDEPGVYRDAHGRLLPEATARRAGYPIERLAKLKLRAVELAKVKERLDRELVIREVEDVYAERNGYKVIAYDNGMAHLVSPDGARYNDMPMPRDIAMDLLEELAGPDKKVQAAKGVEKAK